jgi:hypothetical protein
VRAEDVPVNSPQQVVGIQTLCLYRDHEKAPVFWCTTGQTDLHPRVIEANTVPLSVIKELDGRASTVLSYGDQPNHPRLLQLLLEQEGVQPTEAQPSTLLPEPKAEPVVRTQKEARSQLGELLSAALSRTAREEFSSLFLSKEEAAQMGFSALKAMPVDEAVQAIVDRFVMRQPQPGKTALALNERLINIPNEEDE